MNTVCIEVTGLLCTGPSGLRHWAGLANLACGRCSLHPPSAQTIVSACVWPVENTRTHPGVGRQCFPFCLGHSRKSAGSEAAETSTAASASTEGRAELTQGRVRALICLQRQRRRSLVTGGKQKKKTGKPVSQLFSCYHRLPASEARPAIVSKVMHSTVKSNVSFVCSKELCQIASCS